MWEAYRETLKRMHTVGMEQAPEVEILEQMSGEQSLPMKDTPPQEENGEKATTVLELPLLPVRNTVLFPNVVMPLMVGREQSLKAIEEAVSKNRSMFLVTQLSEVVEDPGPDDLHAIGVECVIDRILKLPDGS